MAGLFVAAAAEAPAASPVRPAVDPLVINDASRLNATRVARHASLDVSTDTLAALRQLLTEAEVDDRPIVVGGARHSMGGQSLYAGASAVTATASALKLEITEGRYRVPAGARWHAVGTALDRIGLSVAVMQSNNDFSVGGTLSVNGHGWAAPYGAFAATVRSFRLLLADGELVNCSSAVNAELFRAALGGYGLLGILLDVELDAVPNVVLRPSLRPLPATSVGPAMAEAAMQPGLRMVYGRLSVTPGSFLTEALLVTFTERSGVAKPLQPGEESAFGFVSRTLLRAQAGSGAGKSARWWAETSLGPRLAPASISRNRLLAQPVASLGRPASGRSDILHEYFLPPNQLADFLAACRRAIPGSGQDLLNVTLRYVAADPVSLLTFAPEPRIAAVMLFDQARTAAAELAMRRLTERLIDEALALGGNFYLPYRLHARRDQVRRAYPGLNTFLELKRRHDPRGRFRNALFDAYLR